MQIFTDKKSLTVQLISRPVKRIKLCTKVCNVCVNSMPIVENLTGKERQKL